MVARGRLGTPLRLSVLFVLLAGLLFAMLGWLWRSLLAQEDRAQQAREFERLEQTATLVSREIDRSLGAWEAVAAAPANQSAALPAGTTLVVFDATGVVRIAGAPLAFLPAVVPGREPSGGALAAAAAAEFRSGDLTTAAALYEEAAANRVTRAQALLGLARVLTRQHQPRAALLAYARLAELGDEPAAGFPAALVARRERAAILEALGDETSSRQEADALRTALVAGAFRVDRATFDFFLSTPEPVAEAPAVMLAEAAADMWPYWQQGRGRRLATAPNARVSVWHTGTPSAAVVGSLDALMSSVRSLPADLGADAALHAADGRAVWGVTQAPQPVVERSLGAIGLPLTLRLTARPLDPPRTGWMARRNALTLGFVLMASVIAAAGYTVFRSIDRELSVARLQSDFVAAVSHEFRSPLTAMRHVTEVLEEGTASPDQVTRYYQALARETRRLHGLVEHLLDFGRMRTGHREYRLEPTDAVALTRDIVDAWRPDVTSSHRIECRTPPRALTARIDRDALALALRNLLDNALKYSPAGSTVVVAVETRGNQIGISVEDQGPGIPAEEQRSIFRQFVRGSAARSRQIKGTGIGLTMADQIVRAHGGRIALRSVEGQGSTFTMWLPREDPS